MKMVKTLRNVGHLYTFQIVDGLQFLSCWSYMRLELCRGGIKNAAL